MTNKEKKTNRKWCDTGSAAENY